MINVERQVQAGPERVWAVVSQVSRWAELLPTVDRVSPKSDGAPAVGSRYALKQPGLPVLVYEITAWAPGSGFTWEASAPGVRTIGTHAVSAAGDASLLTLGLRWEGALAPVVRRLYGARTQRYVEQEADAFAALAEQRP